MTPPRSVRFNPNMLTMKEEQWQRTIEEAASYTGWVWHHTAYSIGSAPGYPDLTLFNERQKRAMWIEVKTESGVVTAAQRMWLGQIQDAGQEAYVIRPRHYDAMEQVLKATEIDDAVWDVYLAMRDEWK